MFLKTYPVPQSIVIYISFPTGRKKNDGFNIVWFLKLFKDELLLC